MSRQPASDEASGGSGPASPNSQSGVSLLPQVILLLIALAGWTAFAAAFFGHIQANKEIARLKEQTEEMIRVSDEAHSQKDRLIDILKIRVDQLEQQQGKSGDKSSP